ncbi:MAG: RNA methyltransferase [Candidatus Eremiobacteraeota bacterium]|nr:RNA methyltransferase [Candidatus Eremiobacteraeota bacterium]
MASSALPSGFHHPQVRAARLLHQKKHRQTQRCFLIEGITLVREALDAGAGLHRAYWVAPANPAVDALRRRLTAAGVATHSVDERVMASLASTASTQGIIAVAAFVHHPPDALSAIFPPGRPGVVLILDGISDPGNAGTLVRSAHAFGAQAVCFGRRSVDPYNDKTVRATMGTLFRIPIIAYDDWPPMKRELDAAQLTIVAAQAGAADVRDVTVPERLALLIGHERRGHRALPPGDMASLVGIPQTEDAESLNAAVAGSIILYEIARRQRIERRAPNAE